MSNDVKKPTQNVCVCNGKNDIIIKLDKSKLVTLNLHHVVPPTENDGKCIILVLCAF